MAYKTSELTKDRLLRAAESLLAYRGIDNVSAREIAKAAKIKNNYAVSYHFGSKDKLIRAIMRKRVMEIDTIRMNMLKSHEIGSDELKFYVECLLLPQLSIRDKDGFPTYAAIQCQYLPKYFPTGFPWRGEDGQSIAPGFDKVLQGLRSCVPDLPQDIFDRRLTNASLLFLNVLVSLSRDKSLPKLDSAHPLVIDAIRQSKAVFGADWCDDLPDASELRVSAAVS